MTHSSLAARRNRRTAIVAAASFATALTALVGVSGVSGASAAEPPFPGRACTPYDTDSNLDSDALSGMAVTGLTVSQGTEPEQFTGTVLGSIDDGIAPGVDLIMARLSSAEIDRVGVWAGMSGSPVYTENGRLLGAVAYGLSFGPSTVAGITPAAAMFDVADRLSDATPAGKVAIPSSLQRSITGSSRVSARAVESGLKALKTPLGVSGVPSDMKLRKVKRKLGVANVKLFRSSPAPVNATATAAEKIVPGGNFAAGISYGEVSFIGYGTATAVCDRNDDGVEEVIGFGHPFDYNGDTTLSMHGGSAVYVQEDPVFGGYKVVNPSAPVGTVSQDRLAGIAGTLGDVPETTVVTSTVTEDANDNGAADTGERTRTSGETYVSDDYWLDYVAWVAQLLNVAVVFDSFGPGSATTSYSITGSTNNVGTGDDEPFSLDRANRFQSDWSIPYYAAYEVADSIWTLYRNNFAEVDFDTVTVNSLLSDEARLFRVDTVEVKKGGEWKKVTRSRGVTAKPGSTLHFKVTMDSYRNRYGTKVEKIAVPVPEVTRRNYGYLQIGGGDSFWFGRSGGGSFAGLVEKLETAPRNDDLVAQLFVRERRSPRIRETYTEPVGEVVRGGEFFSLQIKTGKKGGGGGEFCRTAARGC